MCLFLLQSWREVPRSSTRSEREPVPSSAVRYSSETDLSSKVSGRCFFCHFLQKPGSLKSRPSASDVDWSKQAIPNPDWSRPSMPESDLSRSLNPGNPAFSSSLLFCELLAELPSGETLSNFCIRLQTGALTVCVVSLRSSLFVLAFSSGKRPSLSAPSSVDLHSGSASNFSARAETDKGEN